MRSLSARYYYLSKIENRTGQSRHRSTNLYWNNALRSSHARFVGLSFLFSDSEDFDVTCSKGIDSLNVE